MRVDSMPPAPVLDVEGTLARFGGDKKLFADLAGFLLDDMPTVFNNLRHAIATKDAGSVRGSAHALKGLCAGCGGIRAAHVAQDIEDAGQLGDIAQAVTLIESMENELQLLTQALKAYHASSNGHA